MSALEMRKQVVCAYAGSHKGTAWEHKVKKMSDRQVMSIYFRLKKEGKVK